MKHGIYTVHICIFINYKINDNLPPRSNDLSLIIAAKQKGAVQCAARQILFYIHACIYAQLQMITENNIMIEARVERPFISITQIQASLCD